MTFMPYIRATSISFPIFQFYGDFSILWKNSDKEVERSQFYMSNLSALMNFQYDIVMFEC